MAESYRILGQSSPSATTDTTLYTVPSSTSAVISSIVVCNRGSTSGTFRIAARADGESITNKNYLVYDATLNANTTVSFSFGISMDAADVISVYASNTNFSFSIFGAEII